jgi:hypothetical protein
MMYDNISENLTASIFGVKVEAVRSSETLVFCITRQCHNLEDNLDVEPYSFMIITM